MRWGWYRKRTHYNQIWIWTHLTWVCAVPRDSSVVYLVCFVREYIQNNILIITWPKRQVIFTAQTNWKLYSNETLAPHVEHIHTHTHTCDLMQRAWSKFFFLLHTYLCMYSFQFLANCHQSNWIGFNCPSSGGEWMRQHFHARSRECARKPLLHSIH